MEEQPVVSEAEEENASVEQPMVSEVIEEHKLVEEPIVSKASEELESDKQSLASGLAENIETVEDETVSGEQDDIMLSNLDFGSSVSAEDKAALILKTMEELSDSVQVSEQKEKKPKPGSKGLINPDDIAELLAKTSSPDFTESVKKVKT